MLVKAVEVYKSNVELREQNREKEIIQAAYVSEKLKEKYGFSAKNKPPRHPTEQYILDGLTKKINKSVS